LYDRVLELESENADLKQQIEHVSASTSDNPTTMVLVYILAGCVLMLLIGFSWIIMRLKSFVPAGASNDSKK
jgi:hypothetical protein